MCLHLHMVLVVATKKSRKTFHKEKEVAEGMKDVVEKVEKAIKTFV